MKLLNFIIMFKTCMVLRFPVISANANFISTFHKIQEVMALNPSLVIHETFKFEILLLTWCSAFWEQISTDSPGVKNLCDRRMTLILVRVPCHPEYALLIKQTIKHPHTSHSYRKFFLDYIPLWLTGIHLVLTMPHAT